MRNAEFTAGDRLDIFATIDNQAAPLVLDALVTQNSPTAITLLVNRDDFVTLYYTRELGLDLQYRQTIVPEIADYASNYFDAQAEHEQPVAP